MATKSKKMWGVLDMGTVSLVFENRRDAVAEKNHLNWRVPDPTIPISKPIPAAKAIRITVTWEVPDGE